MSAKLLMDALAEMRKGTPNVDLGDMSRRMSVEPRVAAIEKMLPKKTPVDDWGWKGGKPGEIDANMYIDYTARLNEPNYGGLSQKEILKTDTQAHKQMTKLTGFDDLSDDEVSTIMDSLWVLQQEGIPRAYTGKVYKSLLKRSDNDFESINDFVGSIGPEYSSLMSPMTNKQRTTFLEFIDTNPTRNIDEAGNAVSLMDSMTNEQRTTFLQLLPTWKGDLYKLANVARNLYKR
jgi:hypothetical protein